MTTPVNPTTRFFRCRSFTRGTGRYEKKACYTVKLP
jgi:hypothetical protein